MFVLNTTASFAHSATKFSFFTAYRERLWHEVEAEEDNAFPALEPGRWGVGHLMFAVSKRGSIKRTTPRSEMRAGFFFKFASCSFQLSYVPPLA